MSQWVALAKASKGTHLLSSYNNENSSGIMYNLYADKLLQLNLVPRTVNIILLVAPMRRELLIRIDRYMIYKLHF